MLRVPSLTWQLGQAVSRRSDPDGDCGLIVGVLIGDDPASDRIIVRWDKPWAFEDPATLVLRKNV